MNSSFPLDDSHRAASESPALSPALLADFDAGLLDADTASRIQTQLDADPAAQRVVDALAATRTDLAAHRVDEAPMPQHVSDRIDQTIDLLSDV